MLKYKGTGLFLIVAGLLSILDSCTPGSCLEETEAFLKASLYSYKTKKSAAPDSITVYGLGISGDSIYKKDNSVRIARFPLNPAADSSAFVVRINGTSDTVIFRHTSFPHLISKECGYTYYYYIQPPLFSRNIIDSIATKSQTVTNLNEQNIYIFY